LNVQEQNTLFLLSFESDQNFGPDPSRKNKERFCSTFSKVEKVEKDLKIH
jgi:hypothetical protein